MGDSPLFVEGLGLTDSPGDREFFFSFVLCVADLKRITFLPSILNSELTALYHYTELLVFVLYIRSSFLPFGYLWNSLP